MRIPKLAVTAAAMTGVALLGLAVVDYVMYTAFSFSLVWK